MNINVLAAGSISGLILRLMAMAFCASISGDWLLAFFAVVALDWIEGMGKREVEKWHRPAR